MVSIRLSRPTGATDDSAVVRSPAFLVCRRLTQLPPDQVRAFDVARGFDLADPDVFAGVCVDMTVLRNDAAPGTLDFRLSDRQIRHNEEVRPLPPLDDLPTPWAARGVADSARLALRWAQFPSEQSYAQGEWNQDPQFKERGLTVLAVNLGEDMNTVFAFIG